MSLAPHKLASFSALDLDGAERQLHRPPGLADTAGAALRRWRRRTGRTVQALRRLLARYRRRPLTLELVERNVTFHTLAEFEFALSSKTEFPVDKIPDLMHRRPEELRWVATHIRQVEKRFAQVLTESIREPAFIGELLREVEIKLFSRDHGWRDLVEALNQHGAEFDGHKKLVVVKYMQYLASRQDVMRSLYLDKTRGDAAPRTPLADPRPGVSLHDTEIFDDAADGLQAEAAFAPLPRGETVMVQLDPGEPLELRLAGHRFRLHGGSGFCLVDEAGERYLLSEGKNLVGRSTSADVVVSGWLRGVSRRHVIIEPVAGDTVLFTDISSHGTAVPERMLDG